MLLDSLANPVFTDGARLTLAPAQLKYHRSLINAAQMNEVEVLVHCLVKLTK